MNNGYCSLLEPKSISGGQFAEWIKGRNPGTYVAVHYLKLIDFTFGLNWKLTRIACNGQRGLVGPADGPTWDSVQLQVVYTHPDDREAAFDIHTSSGHCPTTSPATSNRKSNFGSTTPCGTPTSATRRGDDDRRQTPHEIKYTPNHHYNGRFLEPWGEQSQRGYGIEILRRFFEEVAFVEHGGPPAEREARLREMRSLTYNDVTADRNCVAIVQAMEAILKRHANGDPAAIVEVNGSLGGLVLLPRHGEPKVLYAERV